MARCSKCNGFKVMYLPCRYCHGKGKRVVENGPTKGKSYECKGCNGTGRLIPPPRSPYICIVTSDGREGNACLACKGTGEEPEKKSTKGKKGK